MVKFKCYASDTLKGGPVMVTVIKKDGSENQLNPRNDLMNHSPDGFQYGYGGSGPAQLALAICSYVLGDEKGLSVYQQYKFAVIAKLPYGQEWEITDDEVRETVKELLETK
jgi:hypothetical protein